MFSSGFYENKRVEIGYNKSLNYLDEGKLHFEKDGLGKYIIFKMFIKTFQKCSFLSISQVNDAFTLRGVNMGPWRSRSRSCG